jgi:hypothetical protein
VLPAKVVLVSPRSSLLSEGGVQGDYRKVEVEETIVESEWFMFGATLWW